MNIGIDLDNTIINYEEVFLRYAQKLDLIPSDWTGSKNSIRSKIREGPDGETHWMRLQGKVYGEGVRFAKLYPGVERFLWRCRVRGLNVHLISHKTEFGHLDSKKISLREAALRFLKNKGLYSGDSESLVLSVNFFSSRDEKVAEIVSSRFTWFIDDLIEVVKHLQFPSETNAIWFNPNLGSENNNIQTAVSWVEIENTIFSKWSRLELIHAAQEISKQHVKEICWVGGHGNSGIAKVSFLDGSYGALKLYAANSQQERIDREYRTFKILRELGNRNVPQSIGSSSLLGMAVYEWIAGSLISEVNAETVSKASKLLRFLQTDEVRSRFEHSAPASAAVFSREQLEQQIANRIKGFEQAPSVPQIVSQFIQKEIAPAFETIRVHSRRSWPNVGCSDELNQEGRVLSPSDFGAHNWLQREDGGISFLDFEYFGWDDPAKLICDFLLHPAMVLTKDARSRWIHETEKLYGFKALQRANSMYGLIGITWSLIVLNKTKEDMRVRFNNQKNTEPINKGKYIQQQLCKSKEALNQVKLACSTPDPISN
jgi:hypothetical protein